MGEIFVRLGLWCSAGALLAACVTVPESPPAAGRDRAGPPAPLRTERQRPAQGFSPGRTLALCPGSRAPSGFTIASDRTITGYSPFIATQAGPLMRAPVDAACLSSPFGHRPGVGAGTFHRGLDLANRAGSNIRAAGDGRVIFAGEAGDYGRMVRILHGAGLETLYAHLGPELALPEIGAQIFAGEIIGRMGQTGNATGIHLHYEVYVDGEPVDPISWGPSPAGA